jgi:16S rRNA U516 pseudouridylate synthase RsuA-like enzyme
VLELKRLQIGELKLDNLPVGMWRVLKPKEVISLKLLSDKKEEKKHR